MIKTLLVIAAVGGVVSIGCFSAVNMMGGFPHGPFHHRGHGQGGSGFWDDGGPDETRDLAWAGGERLDFRYPAEIVFTQGPQVRFTVTGPKGLVEALRVDGDVLATPYDDDFPFGRHHSRGRLRIAITAPSLHEFHMSGADKLTLTGFDQDSLILHASGAADVEGQGKARRLEAHISGAGHLDLGRLPVDDAVVSISGAGDADLDPHVSADVSISGAGHVTLRSRPPNLQTHISGFGSVDSPPSGTIAQPPASSTPPTAPKTKA